jgi:hypothetical protein
MECWRREQKDLGIRGMRLGDEDICFFLIQNMNLVLVVKDRIEDCRAYL